MSSFMRISAIRILVEPICMLAGLTTLSDAAAKSLSRHMGDLSLNSLTILSDAAAASLRWHKGHLSLDRLIPLPKVLRSHRSFACKLLDAPSRQEQASELLLAPEWYLFAAVVAAIIIYILL